MVKKGKKKTVWKKLGTEGINSELSKNIQNHDENVSTSIKQGFKSEEKKQNQGPCRSSENGIETRHSKPSCETNVDGNLREENQPIPRQDDTSIKDIPREEVEGNGAGETIGESKEAYSNQEEKTTELLDSNLQVPDEKTDTSSKLEESSVKIPDTIEITCSPSRVEEDTNKSHAGSNHFRQHEGGTRQTSKGFNSHRNSGNVGSSYEERYNKGRSNPSQNRGYNNSRNSGNQWRNECGQNDGKSPRNHSFTNRKGGNTGGKIFVETPTDEQDKFLKYVKSNEAGSYTKVQEVEQDLFNVGVDYALAHCVAEDMSMGSGIAVEFRKRFQRVPELLNQGAKTGGLAILQLEGRFIYYLVTKAFSRGKPTYGTLWSSLCRLRDHMRDNNVKKLAIPRIACGLDRLEWDIVKPMLEFLFRDEKLDILVCNLQVGGTSATPLKTCRIFQSEKPITEIESETTIIYFVSKDSSKTETMKNLDRKFKIYPDFDAARKELGHIIRTQPMYNKYILYGCIVKDKHDDQFDYVAFNECLCSIRKNCKKDNFYYVAFQKEQDDILTAKILTLMKHTLRDIEIYVCGCTETLSNVEE